MYRLFLDDERNPKNVIWVQDVCYNGSWRIVRNYNEFVAAIEMYKLPSFISFDHDLADVHYSSMLKECDGEKNVDYGPEKTGFDCAKWLIEYCMDNNTEVPEYAVHSMNPIGAKRIRDYIEGYKKNA